MASKSEPCPKCREQGRDRRGDNFQRWPDGHGHCFSCLYHEFDDKGTTGSMLNRLEIEALKKMGAEYKEKPIALPEDASTNIDWRALHWLAKYDIEMHEVKKYKFHWSASKKWLIFPFYAGDYEPNYKRGTLMGWQGRSFDPDSQMAYFKVGGFSEFYHVLNLTDGIGDDLIIVEDFECRVVEPVTND